MHLQGHFAGWRVLHITTPAIRAYVEKRQGEGAQNATINRELVALKRMFNLALMAEKLPRRPYIPTLTEDNTPGPGSLRGRRISGPPGGPARLSEARGDLRLYVFGWRKSEILGLTWDRVEMVARTVRLDPGSTKNREGRTVVLTEGLQDILAAQ